MRHKAHAPIARTRDRACGQGTRPSLGPSIRACRSSLCTQRSNPLSGGAFEAASRLGKPTQVGETSTGAPRTDGARLAACHRSRKGEGVTRQKRKEVETSVLRGHESSGLVARTSIVTLQKSVGDVWPRISSAHALQKGRSGSSERGPSSGRTLAGETVSECFE